MWFLLLILPINAIMCQYPAEIQNIDGYLILKHLPKIQFINLFVSDCVRTDGPCPPGYSPSCGTLNGRRTYLNNIANMLEYTNSCDEIRMTSNLPTANGYRFDINPTRFFIQCEQLCNTINATHFWSNLAHCPKNYQNQYPNNHESHQTHYHVHYHIHH